MASVPASVPDVIGDSDAQAYVGRPVRGVTPGNLADTVNALLGWRHLRAAYSQFTPDTSVAEAVPGSAAYHVRWTSSPTGRYVWLGLWVLAIEPASGSGAALEVVVNLHDVATGAVIDGPIYWRYTPAAPANPGHGRLPMAPAIDPAAPLYVRAGIDVQHVQTGWDLPLNPADQSPRLLDLGSNQATDVEVRIFATNVRVYSATVLEAYRSEL